MEWISQPIEANYDSTVRPIPLNSKHCIHWHGFDFQNSGWVKWSETEEERTFASSRQAGAGARYWNVIPQSPCWKLLPKGCLENVEHILFTPNQSERIRNWSPQDVHLIEAKGNPTLTVEHHEGSTIKSINTLHMGLYRVIMIHI